MFLVHDIQLNCIFNFIQFSFLYAFKIQEQISLVLFYFLFPFCQAKIPDIEKCLEVVATLKAKKGTGEVRSQFVFTYQL